MEYLVRSHTGTPFRNVVMTSDNSFLIAPAADKGNRDCVIIYNANTGALISKIPIKLPGFKVRILCKKKKKKEKKIVFHFCYT